MILWFGKKKKADKSGETPIEPNPPQDAGIEIAAPKDTSEESLEPTQSDTRLSDTPAIDTPEAVLEILDAEKAPEKKSLFGGLFGAKKKAAEEAALDAEVKADVENYFKDPYDKDAVTSHAPFRDDDGFEPPISTPEATKNIEPSVPSNIETPPEAPTEDLVETPAPSTVKDESEKITKPSNSEQTVPANNTLDEPIKASETDEEKSISIEDEEETPPPFNQFMEKESEDAPTAALTPETESKSPEVVENLSNASESTSKNSADALSISDEETNAAVKLAEDTFEEDTPAYDITENAAEEQALTTLEAETEHPAVSPPAETEHENISPIAETKKPGFFSRMSQGLKRSSSKLADGITSVFTKKKLDDDTLEDLEDLLISSDLGANVAMRVCENIRKDRFDKEVTDEEIKSALATEIARVLKPREEILDLSEGPSPRVVLFVGVNGSGKTTTIGKIASKLSAQGADILLAAGDTFRAAAVEQLKVWADRANAGFLSRPDGADSAGLAFDAIQQAKRENRDLVLIDTAGRLQNRTELMDELAKVVRAIRKVEPTAPHDVILVLDATVGQNALSQVEAFKHTAGVTGLVMTKLDGTAKGGVLVAIADKHEIPIHFVGIGEKAEDLYPFSAQAFANALVGLSDDVTGE